MFIDASSIVAILANEPEKEAFHRKIKLANRKSLSGLAKYEAALALRRISGRSIVETYQAVQEFAHVYAITQFVPIDQKITDAAITAFERYGRDNKHPAKLNMGDCFSYACAKVSEQTLLFKGNDFIHTDIKAA